MIKTALITGGAKGIGKSIVHKLHRAGLNVIIHYNTSRTPARLMEHRLNYERDASALAIKANLANYNELESLINDAVKFNGKIDILINNAAIFYPTPIDSISIANWNDIININLIAPMFLASLFVRQAITPHSIINITDIHGTFPLNGYAIYSISKAGLIMLTKSLAKELAPHIRVNAISPGAITWPKNISETSKNEILDKIALNRAGYTEDIAHAVLFLIEQADYTTGQILTVDGGQSLYS